MKKNTIALEIVGFLSISFLCLGVLNAGSEPNLSDWVKNMMQKVVATAEQKLTPTSNQGESATAVAGLRGDEKSDERLEPYWKGELSVRSQDYKAYHEIELKMQDGQYAKALGLIEKFQQTYAKSKLMPEVTFTQGLAFAGMGNHKGAVEAFEKLIKQYPNHDLASASREGIARLKKA